MCKNMFETFLKMWENLNYAMQTPSLPLKSNFNPDNYRLYFADTSLLIGSLDEEVQEDLRNIKYGIKLCNKNIGFNGEFYTFPYFMVFLLKRFLREKKS